MKRVFKVATRPSPLALKQAQMSVEYLSKFFPDAVFEILEIRTTGDKMQNWSLEKSGGKGLFTKEIEDALLDKSADIAIHSAKDLPTLEPQGLVIAGTLPRGDSRDVLIKNPKSAVPSLIATGSPRRRLQLKAMFPQAVWTEMRGNVETRLRKLESGFADATVLSAAGLERLGITSFGELEFKYLKLQNSVPAVGQGIIAIQCRLEDFDTFAPYTDTKTNFALTLEREFLRALGGGCQAAYAAHYDGINLHCYHENCGYQKIRFSTFDLESMKAQVSEIAEGLK